jgi:hypothetical protein
LINVAGDDICLTACSYIARRDNCPQKKVDSGKILVERQYRKVRLWENFQTIVEAIA